MMAALKVIFRIWDFVQRTMDPLKGSIGDPLKQETSGMELRHGKCMVLRMDGRKRRMEEGRIIRR